VRQAERRLVTRTCGQLTDARERGSFLAVPDPDGDREVPIVFVEGRSWLVAFSDTGGPEPWKAATALHGKVTEKQWCPPADPGPDAT
jgi:hypothetical protein